MDDVTAAQVQTLLRPYLKADLPERGYEQILRYLAIFQRWHTRVSLTTVSDPAQVVQRHFGEGFALAAALPPFVSLLDFGSGAGFPGLPIAIVQPAAEITLAESHKKKAGFLKEAVGTMGLRATVWADRAENLPKERLFDVITLRAVDNMTNALRAAVPMLRPLGTLAFFGGEHGRICLPEGNWAKTWTIEVPRSPGCIVLARLAA